jgi:ATP-binding cassette subfamily C protein CydD
MAIGGVLVPVGMALAGIGAAVASQQQFDAMARLQTRFLDRVRGIATIVLAGQADAEATRLQAAAQELATRTMRILRVAFLSSAILDAAAVAVLVLLALRAGMAWRAGDLRPVSVVFTLILVAEFFAPLRAFAAAYQDRIHANTAAATFGAASLDMPASAPAQPAPAIRTVAASGVTVAFEDVSFTWDPARGPALSGLTFRVPANETAVLVGPSGSGKSTVLELLLGFAVPATGRITVNGADLATLTPAALSRITAWIGQRPVLFAGSIRDNIRFGHQDATDGAIDEAAKAAGLQAVAAVLPQGLDTLIGEGGYGLSGGQAQRVAIARAFVRNAPLLLMDEPTAHLDPATEADVLESLKRLAIGRTVILAAHSSAATAFGGRRIPLDRGHLAATQGVA